MSYRHVQFVKGRIGASVIREAWPVMGVAKKGTRLEIVQREVEFKELEHQTQPQSSNLQQEGGITNHGKAELLHLYQGIPQLPHQLCQVYFPFVVNLHISLWILVLPIPLFHICSSIAYAPLQYPLSVSC